MKRLSLFLTALLLLVQAGQSFAQGAGSALNFSNQPLQTSAVVAHNIGTGNFTWEAWIKPSVPANGTSGTGTGILANGNYAPALYASTGGTAPASGYGSLGIYWSGIGGSSWKNSGVKLAANKWYHVALVRSDTTLSFYVNGVKAPNTFTINATASMANAAMRLGYSGDGSESLQGNMDEIRVWSVARTATELRDNMCHKLTGTETGLKVYYRLDEATGTTLSSAVAAISAPVTFPASNAPAWATSGAAIGDTSVQLYATSYGTQALSLGSTANGTVMVNNITDVSNGVHLYRINNVPNTTTGIPVPGSNNVYYGAFTADTALSTSGSSYDLQYNYSAFPAAVTNASGINLYTRIAADVPWTLSAATNTQATHLFQLGNTGRKELIIGNFVQTITCNQPTALNAQNITPNTADLSWVTGGSNAWNMAYGTGSFTPASGGMHVNNLSASNYSLSGLSANTDYTFYVQDSCASINSASTWAGPFSFTTLPDYGAKGSGYAINFQGTSQNDHVNLGDSLSGALATTSFTLETWIKFNNNTADPAFIGNKNWASGQNTGILWCWNGNNNLRFNFKPAGGTRQDYDINVPDPSKWNHIAMVVDRHGMLTAYLNGVQTGTPIDISADTGRSLDGALPIRIGQDGTGTYGPKFKGSMDELRIWNTVLSDTAIRAGMCHKLTGNESNLMAYYRMDETSGTVLTNSSAANASIFNGTLTNAPQRVVSGAAIGDTSVYIYAASWNGLMLSLGNNNYGNLMVDSIGSSATGIHIYRVNNIPNYPAGIADIGGTASYYGVFSAGNLNANYRLRYDYNAYPAAVATPANLHLYSRNNNAATAWIQLAAANNTTAHTLTKQGALGVREVLLADFVVPACPAPDSVTIDNIDTSAAVLHFSAPAGDHILQFGPAGFSLGSGTTVTFSGNSYSFSNLQPATTYDIYLMDSCSTTAQSAWVYTTFTTGDPCGMPDMVGADSITSSMVILKWHNNALAATGYDVSWGPSGFGDPDIGIIQSTTDTFATFTGMSVNTSYDFYIRVNCNSSIAQSNWVGPFTYSTVACDVPYGLNTQSVTQSTAVVSWITGGAPAHNIQYGASGFAIGSGTVINNVSTSPYTITGLQGNTTYDVYVQDSCSETLGGSAWVGPVTFKTQQGTGINDPGSGASLNIFPNPSHKSITVSVPQDKVNKIILVNNMGQILIQVDIKGKEQTTFSVEQLSSGIYFLEVSTDKGQRLTSRIAVQH